MKKLRDADNTELAGVLDSLLAEDVDITVREVARRHSALRNASAFTRNSERMALIAQAQQRQQQFRTCVSPHARRVSSLAEKVKQKDERIAQLESQVKALVASHAACIQAVIAAGGMAALERFWKNYQAVGDQLRTVSAFPDRAELIVLNRGKKEI